MIKAVFFDAIDTLFAAYPDKVGMYQRIIKELTGLEVDYSTMSTVWDEIIQETESVARAEMTNSLPSLAWDGFNERILNKLGYKDENIKEIAETLRLESWTNPSNFSLYPDVREVLAQLSEQNILIGCISNEAEGLNKFFVHFDIADYFQCIVISEVEGCEKPGKKIFEIALNKLDIKPNEAIYIGDSLISDYEGAMNAGIKPVLIDRSNSHNNKNIVKICDLNEIVKMINKENQNATTFA